MLYFNEVAHPDGKVTVRPLRRLGNTHHRAHVEGCWSQICARDPAMTLTGDALDEGLITTHCQDPDAVPNARSQVSL